MYFIVVLFCCNSVLLKYYTANVWHLPGLTKCFDGFNIVLTLYECFSVYVRYFFFCFLSWIDKKVVPLHPES